MEVRGQLHADHSVTWNQISGQRLPQLHRCEKLQACKNLRTTLLPNNQTFRSLAVSEFTASFDVPKFDILPTVCGVCVCVFCIRL